MDVFFGTRAIEKRLGSDRARVKAYGAEIAKRLSLRLTQMHASDSLAVMRTLPGKCHELAGDRKGQLAVSVTDNLRLVFEPADDPLPLKTDGGLDWERVTSVRILEVVDYHGD